MLNAKKVAAIKTPGTYCDGPGRHGLMLMVRPAAAGGVRKSWVQRATVAGKRTNIGLGRVDFFSLAEARKRAYLNAKANARGEALPYGGARRGAVHAAVPTFAAAIEQCIGLQRQGWKPGSRNEANWRSSLAHSNGLLTMPVDAISTEDVISVLSRLVTAGKAPTAKALRQRIRTVFEWARSKGYRSDNPADGRIDAALPKNGHRVEHRAAVPYADVPAVVAAIRAIEKPTWTGMKLATEFAILTGCRSAEVTGAKWSEIDLAARTWTVPESRMKAGREHRVPLSDAALQVLQAARERHSTGLVFRAPRGGEIERLVPVLRAVGCDADVHGFRSSLRDWCSENGVDDTVAERCIAHYPSDATERAYHRTDRFEERVPVMAKWAKHVAVLP